MSDKYLVTAIGKSGTKYEKLVKGYWNALVTRELAREDDPLASMVLVD